MGVFYFKWWGVYTQGDGVGATGGKGGEGLATEWFMMRIGIPNGIISSSQLRTIGGIARKYARNLADITVRQNIQLHWLSIESLPEVVDALDAIGLSPKGACGDVVRNVTGCPLAGVAADERIDASPIARAIAHELTANSEFYNLPRKFKISASGCPWWCTYPEINDIGFTPAERDGEVGYSVRVGGGLSQRAASCCPARCLCTSRPGRAAWRAELPRSSAKSWCFAKAASAHASSTSSCAKVGRQIAFWMN